MGDINLKRKVTLKRKSESLSSEGGDVVGRKSNKGLIIGLFLLLLVGGSILLYTILNRETDSNTISSQDDTSNSVVENSSDKINSSDFDNPMNTQESMSQENTDYNYHKVSNDSEVKDHSNTQKSFKSDKGVANSEKSTKGEKDTIKEEFEDNVSAKSSHISSMSVIESKARRVIRGDYGNGKTRKSKLGDEYGIVQKRVNELYRKGYFR